MLLHLGQVKNIHMQTCTVALKSHYIGIYSASKAAVHSLSDTLRMELKPFNIQVSVVAPGNINTHTHILFLLKLL